MFALKKNPSQFWLENYSVHKKPYMSILALEYLLKILSLSHSAPTSARLSTNISVKYLKKPISHTSRNVTVPSVFKEIGFVWRRG